METEKIKLKINSLEREISELKKVVWTIKAQKKVDNMVWSQFLKDSEQVSDLWKGNGAVREIRKQREKDV